MAVNDSVFAWAEVSAIEKQLCAILAPFFDFGSHAIYFTPGAKTEPEFIPEEERLLLPLAIHNGCQAILRLDSVKIETGFLPRLKALTNLCMERLALSFGRMRDSETGLYSEDAFIEFIAEKIEDRYRSQGKGGGCFGVAALKWLGERDIRAEADFQTIAYLWRSLAASFRKSLPAASKGARLGRLEGSYELGLLFGATGREACNRIARRMLASLSKNSLDNPVSKRKLKPEIAAGHALYPQDLSGKELLLPAWEQAILLRDRARLAASRAWQTPHLSSPVLAFAWARSIGGVIETVLPSGLLRINLGKQCLIKEGQRFYVIARNSEWSRENSKGQIVVQKVGPEYSLAEIYYIQNAGVMPEPGDRLLLMQGSSQSDSNSGLLRHGDFLSEFASRCRNLHRFAFGIARFKPVVESGEKGRIDLAPFAEKLAFGLAPDSLIGQYGRDGLIFFTPDPDKLEKALHELWYWALASDFEAISGVFNYPCLDFGKMDSEANALKALEYAALLPEPKIGILDGLALAIAGDKRFSQGDNLGALEEYKRALLLRPDDPEILNSLGVCLASLGRGDQARQIFLQALATAIKSELRAQIQYNLGNLFLKDNDLASAREAYCGCIRSAPGHIYAWTRLGQLYDKAGRPKSGKALYRHAARLAKDDPDALNMINRRIAKLEAERNQTDRAREILHDSLLRNPADLASLLLLARTYLEDDPATAETLSRKCLSLGGDAWEVLREALSRQGKQEEAGMADRMRSINE